MNRKRSGLAVLLGIFLAALWAASGWAQVPECNPFNEDGTVRKTNECVCSDNPNQINFCMTGTEYLAATIGQMAQKSLFGVARNLAGIFWLLDRWAAMLANFALRGEVWTQIRDAILAQLQDIMGGSGGVLDQLIRGQGGLLYLALMFAGLVLILPFAILSGQSPVKLERVVIWGVFVVALFISGTQGFDLIRAVEDLRVGMMQTIIGDELQLAELVASPMMAHPEDALTIPENEPLAMPPAYQQQYFPDLDSAPVWRFRVLVLAAHTTLLEVVTAGEVIQEDALHEWSMLAIAGVIRAGMTLVAAYVLLLLALILMMLSAASLVLIIFFIAALPLGFFEFGATLLGNMAKQYLGVVAVSLFAGVFVRILGEMGAAVFGSDFSLGGMVVYTGALGVVIIALHAGLRSAWQALSGSTGILQSSFAGIGALTGGAPVPEMPGKGALNTAVTTAAAVGLGAVTGGVGMALAAGAGQMLSGSNTGRSIASAVAAVRPDSDKSQAFAAGALSGGSLPVMASHMAVSRRRGQGADGGKGRRNEDGDGIDPYRQRAMPRGTTAAQVALNNQDRLRLAPQWRGTQAAGMYLTPDLGALQRAEDAFFVYDDRESAAAELANAFGDRGLAEQILESFERGGQVAAEQIREVVEHTQAVAEGRDDVTRPDGGLDKAYQEERDQLLQNMPDNDVSPMLRKEVANASIRQVLAVRNLDAPVQARLLAKSISNPQDPAIQVGDTAAQYQLHDLAVQQGWGERQLTTLFVRQREAAHLPFRERQAHVVTRLQETPSFQGTHAQALVNAARLSDLVADTAYVQVPAGMAIDEIMAPTGDGLPLETRTPAMHLDERLTQLREEIGDEALNEVLNHIPAGAPLPVDADAASDANVHILSDDAPDDGQPLETRTPAAPLDERLAQLREESDEALNEVLNHIPAGAPLPSTPGEASAEQSQPGAPQDALTAQIRKDKGDSKIRLENLARPAPIPPSVNPKGKDK